MSTETASAPTTDLSRVHDNPFSISRQRESIAIITEAARRAGSYIANAPHRPIAPSADAVAALDVFRRPLQERAIPAREVLAELDTFGSPATVVQTHGRYFGFVNGGLDPAARGAAVLAGTWDQNAAMAIQSPIAAALDDVSTGWIVEALGLPSTSIASFCGGATIANLTGIIAARDALYARLGWDVSQDGLVGAPALRVIVGEEVHATTLKALRLAGFGLSAVERVPTDDSGAIIADAFPTDTDERTLVLLQSGNVNTGASDPFAAIIPGVRERGGWVHVDGAFGMWAAASPKRRHQVAGIELADSWGTDAHKWLNVPYDSGIVIVRERADLERACAMSAAYLATTDARANLQLGIQSSQRARGIETWAMLASHGKQGLADLIDRTCDLAQRFADALATEGVHVLAPVALNQVLVRFADADGDPSDEMTTNVIAAVQAEGTLWAGPSQWHGSKAMRLSVSDAATTADDIDVSAAVIVRLWRQLAIR